ncbi:hypothetical protein BDN70DRAFT_147824 [Pholiota conissans]|uniref:Uncharacterized protein n=1 Tax=Pholiota conissans TaxID=109636 RepID=A0A9P5YWC0_9AGAR|nr:hypothetical protein BDN70DRAFT_147824 [Pholiota conissans]
MSKNFDIGDRYEIPSDIVVENCIKGAGWSRREDAGYLSSATATFDIDLSADNIYLLSRGCFSSGTVNVTTSSEQPKETATIDVVAEYRGEGMLDLARVCLTSRLQNQKGVGIFTPMWRRAPHRHDETILGFKTTITLPEGVSISGFETDVPNTPQTIGDLASVSFTAVSLKGTNAPITVEALSAVKGHVYTTNAGIRGSFNTTSSLILDTINGPIYARVGLRDEGERPTLVASTMNAHFDGKLSLTTPSGKGGNFSVDTTTTNSRLSVSFLDAPLDSGLKYYAGSTNGRVDVTLHPTYEGDFDILTSTFSKSLVKFFPGPDPSGRGRYRAASVHSDKGSDSGQTIWEDPKKPGHGRKGSGNVFMSTSNAAIVLNIQGL